MNFNNIKRQANSDISRHIHDGTVRSLRKNIKKRERGGFTLADYRHITESINIHSGITIREFSAIKFLSAWVTSESVRRNPYLPLARPAKKTALTRDLILRKAALIYIAADAAHTYSVLTGIEDLINEYRKPETINTVKFSAVKRKNSKALQ